MLGGVNFRGAVSELLKNNLDPNTLLFSNSDGKIQALDLPSNYLTYLDGLRDNIQSQMDDKSNKTYLDTLFYNRVEVDGLINGLINSAPEQLNTLNELSQALNNDANFATTIINLINTKSNIVDVCDKIWVDENVYLKTFLYTKTEIDDLLTNYYTKALTYNKTEVDDTLLNYFQKMKLMNC